MQAEIVVLKAELERENNERTALGEIAARLQAEVLDVDRDKNNLNTKIQALRNTGRALESENDLLIQDRENLEKELCQSRKSQEEMREKMEDIEREMEAKNAERDEFHERFRRLESEKMNILRQNLALESEMEVVKSHAGNYAATIDENRRLRSAQEALENRLAEVTSLYESVQSEVSIRMEEMDSSREKEMADVKQRYIKLFHEKTEELHKVQEEFKAYKIETKDFELRKAEVESLMARSQEATEKQVGEMKQKSEQLEEKLLSMTLDYEKLQESYKNSVETLGSRLFEISDLLKTYQTKEDFEEVKEENVVKTANNRAKGKRRRRKRKDSQANW